MSDYHSLDPTASPPIQPPADLVMPELWQTVWEIGFGIAFLVGVWIMLREIFRSKSTYPIYVWIGCAFFMFAEPLFDVGQTCFYPEIGQHTAFELWGRKMPLFVIPMYAGLVPAMLYPMANRIENGVGPGFYWTVFLGMAGSLFLFEILAVHLGVWSYVGVLWPRILDYPVGITINNSVAFTLAAVAIARCKPYLFGSRAWMGMLIVPVVLTAGEFGTGWPMYSTANSAIALASPMVPAMGALATVVICLSIIWCIPIFSAPPNVAVQGR